MIMGWEFALLCGLQKKTGRKDLCRYEPRRKEAKNQLLSHFHLFFWVQIQATTRTVAVPFHDFIQGKNSDQQVCVLLEYESSK